MTTEMPNDEPTKRGHSDTSLPGAENSANDADELSLLDLLILLAERKWLILGITAFFTISAIVVTLLLPKRYTAVATLLPPQQSSSMGSMLNSQMGSLGGLAALAGGSLGVKNPNDMYVGMFKSRTVEDAMVQHFDLMNEYHVKFLLDARKVFESHANVDDTGKDGLIKISIEDRDPKRAAELANGYVDQFRSLSQNLAITEASQRRVFFERELEKAKNNLADAEEALKKTEQTTGVIQLDSQARALIESAASLRAQITEREVQIEGMETYATGQNAQLVQAQRELEGLRAQLAKLGGSEDSSNGELIVPKGKVPEAGLEYVRKLRDVKYAETIFDILARQFELAKLDEAKEGALVQVVDPAVPPDRKSFPVRSFMVICATFAGLVIGVIWAFVVEGVRRMKNNPATARKIESLKRALTLRRLQANG
jgi:tyrosine-protein kinase Etk/Wzc